MLHFTAIPNSSAKRKWILGLNPKEITYIVPDLATKSEVQRHFFKEKNIKVLEEDSVLRANEFWLKAITQNFFDFQMISSFLAQTLLQQWASESELNITSSGVKRLQGYFQQLLPIITKPTSVDILQQWFNENPESFISWGRWYQLAVMAWQKFNEHQLIPQNCLSAYLLANIGSMNLKWKRKIYFDLGADLNLTEVELIHHLSQELDITVVTPDISLLNKYESLFSTYKLLQEKSSQDHLGLVVPEVLNLPSEDLLESSKKFKRFSTVVSEVKDLTAQVRYWLNNGGKPHEISVVTPNIEKYWPILKPYFDKEGIPLIKNEIIIASTLPSVCRWISKLRVYSGKLSSVDIELIEFAGEEQHVDFENFKKLYSVFYDENDLKRDQGLYDKYFVAMDLNKFYARDEFLIWSLGFWQHSDEHDVLKTIFNQILLECPLKTKMSLNYWLNYLEQIVSKKEITVEKSSYGVHCINLSASSWVESKYTYVVGLSSSQFKVNPVDSIDLGEISKLYQQTGFLVDKFNVSSENYLLSWIFRKNFKEAIFSYPETGINGEVGAPLLFWLEEKFRRDKNTEHKDSPQKSLWDLEQNQRSHTLSTKNLAEKIIQSDLGLDDYQPLEDKKYLDHIRFSPTSIERFIACPFIFMSEKIFNLQDLPDIDFDENPMNRGRLSHAIVESLTEEPFCAEHSDEDLLRVIENCKEKLKLDYYNIEIWHYHRETYLKLAKEFLKAEAEHRLQFPQTKVKHREVKLKLFWDQKEKKLSDKGFPLNTVIDRIDQNSSGDYTVIDYKSSSSQATNFESWTKKKSVQMPLYIMAYQKWLQSKNKEGSFVGAFYYVLKDMSRGKGLKVSSHDQSLFELGSKRGQADQEGLERLCEATCELTAEVVGKVEAGFFAPEPEDVNACGQCNWRSLCRAPHLV